MNLLLLFIFAFICKETFTTLQNVYQNNLELDNTKLNQYIYDRKRLERLDPDLLKDEQNSLNMEKEEYLKRKYMFASETCPTNITRDSKISCINVLKLYEYKNGAYTTVDYSKTNDFALIGFLSWNTNEFMWSGFLSVNYMFGSQNIVLTPSFVPKNIDVSIQAEYLKFTNRKLLDSTSSFFYKTYTILNSKDKIYRIEAGKNLIPLNTGTMLFNRNVVNNSDLMIIMMTIYTRNNNKFWSGFVTINHYTYPGWSDFEKLSGNLNVASTWGGGGEAYIAINDVNATDGEIYYTARAVTSKNIPGDNPGILQHFKNNILNKTVSNNMIYIDQLIDMNKGISQGILALSIWASQTQNLYHVQSRDIRPCYKYWSGLVYIKPFNTQKKLQEIELKPIGNSFNTMNLSVDIDSNNKAYIQVKNVDSLDGTLNYQSTILVSRK